MNAQAENAAAPEAGATGSAADTAQTLAYIPDEPPQTLAYDPTDETQLPVDDPRNDEIFGDSAEVTDPFVAELMRQRNHQDTEEDHEEECRTDDEVVQPVMTHEQAEQNHEQAEQKQAKQQPNVGTATAEPVSEPTAGNEENALKTASEESQPCHATQASQPASPPPAPLELLDSDHEHEGKKASEDKAKAAKKGSEVKGTFKDSRSVKSS